MIKTRDDENTASHENIDQSKKILVTIQKLCKKQFVQKKECQDLYERHVDFQAQIEFVTTHEPHVPEDDNFCKQSWVMELFSIIEFFNLLRHTGYISKPRALFERDKIVRALRVLNKSYSRGIAHVHTFLPESHPLFQLWPSQINADGNPRTSTSTAHIINRDRNREHTRQGSAEAPLRNITELVLGSGAAQSSTAAQWTPGDIPVRPTTRTSSNQEPLIQRSLLPPPSKGLQANTKSPKIVESDQQARAVRNMSSSEVILQLGNYGCRDIADQLDLDSFSDYPISRGGLGEIYQAQQHDGTLVAAKTVRVYVECSDEGTQYLKDMARELRTWGKCNHPNVLKLLGLARFHDQITMISPWMEYGDLPKYLSQNPKVNRYHISAQVSEGLSHLHSHGIVHGDLKGLNILISNEHKPVLTEFGYATLADSTMLFTAATPSAGLSFRWAAPELLASQSKQNQETDVYALGMTILEIFTGKVPFFHKVDYEIYVAVVIKQEIPEWPKDVIPFNENGGKLWRLLARCWKREPNSRPKAVEVSEIMRGILRT
ncbi:Tyrosine kinase catalytic domain protein [Ceratobasidium sp. AG-Ba]|nr:Tyrosine kinase catalytic domain protein [Ceratobasidium sp. AG-Ba]